MMENKVSNSQMFQLADLCLRKLKAAPDDASSVQIIADTISNAIGATKMRTCAECGNALHPADYTRGRCDGCEIGYGDDEEEDAELFYERWEEEREQRMADRAGSCKCGAWQFSEQGVIHVADCCCGAE